MRRFLFVLVAVLALAGVVAYMVPASGQTDKGRSRHSWTNPFRGRSGALDEARRAAALAQR